MPTRQGKRFTRTHGYEHFHKAAVVNSFAFLITWHAHKAGQRSHTHPWYEHMSSSPSKRPSDNGANLQRTWELPPRIQSHYKSKQKCPSLCESLSFIAHHPQTQATEVASDDRTGETGLHNAPKKGRAQSLEKRLSNRMLIEGFC